MTDEELDELIAALRSELIEHDFVWALEDAEARLRADTDRRIHALALVTAIRSMTSTLASVELEATEVLNVEQIVFESDPEGRYAPALGDRTVAGPDRIGMLQELSRFDDVFDELQRLING